MHLLLFFTENMSLKKWEDLGILSREIKPYLELNSLGIEISFITYGDREDLNFSKIIGGINIYCNQMNLPMPLYKMLIHFLHYKAFKSCNIIKTNQMFGSNIALRCAKYFRKPLFSRFGYMLSEFEKNENRKYEKFISMENKVFDYADKIIVTTKSIKSEVEKRINKQVDKILIVPNYVDTDLFKPKSNKIIKYDVLFVGRIVYQKNLISLLKALDTLNSNALIIGNGHLRDELISQFSHLEERITWVKCIPNNELPIIMNQSKLFVLPSHYEGHPKILLEAMSCGMAALGANSPGISGLIKHGINGYLSNIDSDSIRIAINELLSESDLRKSLGYSAREFALKNFSLEKVVKIEYDLYKSIF
tara:strand:- start:940 stop:2028 length:1089 start_codon:yes stop_codon:yes gene_type:complete